MPLPALLPTRCSSVTSQSPLLPQAQLLSPLPGVRFSQGPPSTLLSAFKHPLCGEAFLAALGK